MIFSKKSKSFSASWCEDKYGFTATFSNNPKKIQRTIEDFLGLMTILENRCALLEPATEEDLHSIRGLLYEFDQHVKHRLASKEQIQLSEIIDDDRRWTFNKEVVPEKKPVSDVDEEFKKFIKRQKMMEELARQQEILNAAMGRNADGVEDQLRARAAVRAPRIRRPRA